MHVQDLHVVSGGGGKYSSTYVLQVISTMYLYMYCFMYGGVGMALWFGSGSGFEYVGGIHSSYDIFNE